jgi:hypothetical protein
VFVRQIRNVFERAGVGTRQFGGGGIMFEQGEDPASANVVDEQGELGKSACQEIVQLIDDPGVLPSLRFEPAGDLAEHALLRRDVWCGFGVLRESIAGAGLGLDGIRFLDSVNGRAIVLVALGIAAGDGEAGVDEGCFVGLRCAQGAEEGEQVVGVTAGQIEPDMKMDATAVGSGDGLEPFAKLLIACGRLDQLEVGGGGLQVSP